MNLHRFLSGSGIFVLLAVFVAFLFFLTITLSFLNRTGQEEQNNFPTPTPNNLLSNRERTIPTGEPQKFFNEAQDNGSLVVTSQTPDVWIVLDPPEHTHAEAPTDPAHIAEDDVPPQYPPFRIDDIPVGTHRLIAASEGNYEAQDLQFIIKKGEVTRINIQLKPM